MPVCRTQPQTLIFAGSAGCRSRSVRNPSAVIFSQQEAQPPTLSKAVRSEGGREKNTSDGPRFSKALEVVAAKLLRKNPVERYQTCRELTADLEKVGRNEEVHQLPHSLDTYKQGLDLIRTFPSDQNGHGH